SASKHARASASWPCFRAVQQSAGATAHADVRHVTSMAESKAAGLIAPAPPPPSPVQATHRSVVSCSPLDPWPPSGISGGQSFAPAPLSYRGEPAWRDYLLQADS